MFKKELTPRQMNILQMFIILFFVSIPLFVQLPFKINLFLAWDGAHRISIGQIPYKDFYLPMGFGFWLLPALVFKVFGASLYSLVIAQVFINLIGAFAFRSILKKLGVGEGMMLLSLLVYCISYILINFWPWYNHTVFVFELVAIHFILAHSFAENWKSKTSNLIGACFFLILALFTKQDGGGLAIITGSTLMLYSAICDKSMKWLLFYSTLLVIFSLLFIVPFLPYDFSYWFNYGQSPHNARTNLNDILIDVFEGSQWIKFYLLAVVVILIRKTIENPSFLKSKKDVLLALLTLCILFQAMLVQVTSYIPHNVNIYFHSFAIAFIGYHCISSVANRAWAALILSVFIMFWWSADYWRYGQRIASRVFPSLADTQKNLNRVSKYTWFVEDSSNQSKKIKWIPSSYRSFKHVLLPEGTVEGIKFIMNLPVAKKENIKVLNMSELTPLAFEMGYEPLKNQPMWFHKNVSIFEKEIDLFCHNIEEKKYDLVLFEVIPNLNQFYPDKVRNYLQKNYKKIHQFQAPRDNSKCFIEVYVIPD